MQLGFIGTGEIASAIVTGLSSSGVQSHSICLSPRNSVIARNLALRFERVSIASNNQQVLDRSDTIFIAVRPDVARDVLSDLQFRSDHQVINLVSGLPLQRLAELVAPPGVRITRAVPLPSAAQRLSPTAIFPYDPVAFALFAAVGTVFPAENESEFEAFCAATATIASGLAFNDTIASWLERQGVAAPQARDYTARLFLGVASGAVASEHTFQTLAAKHATAGGINQQFLDHLTEHGLLAKVTEALGAVLHRIRTKS